MSTLEVRLFGRRIGEVAINGELRVPEDWSFQYDRDYAESDLPVALSMSLPVRPAAHVGAVARNWFCNLLPEGVIRDAVVRRLRLPPNDDFALLAAIGGECAGAVSVGAEAAPADDDPLEDLETLLYLAGDGAAEGTLATLGVPHRLSLAGAQDKLAVIKDGERLRLPGAGEISTHILKPDSTIYPGLRDVEALGMRLAEAIGLPVAHAELVTIGGRAGLLLERFDRRPAADGALRLHQEDFCQALGYPPELKYEQQGGPGLAQFGQLLRAASIGPAAVQGLLDWVAYNAVIGNADAHAKNLALLSDPVGARWLAPFYDLVPTIVFSERQVDRVPALRIGAAERIDAVSVDDWRAFAKATGYRAGYVMRTVRTKADAVMATLPQVIDSLAAAGARPARLEIAQAVITANAQRMAGLPRD